MDTTAFYKSLRHGNLVFDIAACSAIGGASLGLFFFTIDAFEGRPFFTPMLLGSVLFTGEAISETAEISVLTIAAYSWCTSRYSPSSAWRRRSSPISPTLLPTRSQ